MVGMYFSAEHSLSGRACGASPAPDGMAQDALARTWTIASLLIGVVWLVAMSRWVLTDSVVPWDSKNQFYAFYRFLAATIEAGASPFWNPYHYGGHPSVADPQSLIFAPLMVLYALFDPAPSMRRFDLLVHAHLLIGGLSIAAIGARARWPVVACVLAAVIFMFGGGAAGRLQHTGIILSYGLFPLALLLLQLALARPSLLIGLAFSFVAASMTLGRNQVALLLCFVLAAAAVAEVMKSDRPLYFLRERGAVLAVMALAVLALIAPPMLLTMQFAALSNRPSIDLEQALLGSLHPAGLAQLTVANIFGSHQIAYWGPSGGTEPLVASTDDSFNYLFVGAVPVILLLWFGIAGGGAFRRGRTLLAAAAALALIYALGRYTPLFAWAFEWVPGVSRFRRPVDGGFVFVAMLALICGAVLADYIREGLPRARRAAIAAVALVGLAMVAAAVIYSGRLGRSGDALVAALTILPIVAVVIGLLVCARGGRMRRGAAVAVTVIAVGELMWWNTAFRLNAEPRDNYAVLEQPSGAAAAALDLVARAVGERHSAGERPRVEVVGLGGPSQNIAMVRSLEAVNGYNPLRIGNYDRLVAPGEANWHIAHREFPASFDGYDCALARTLGLEFVVLARPIEEVAHLARRPVADVLRAGPDVWVYRLKNPSPRLNFSRRVQVADAEAVSGPGWLVVSPEPDRVLIDGDTPPLANYAGVGSAGSARITAWHPARIEIETDSEHGGMLALHETWYPGWIAEVSGRQVPILRADVLFRGIEVPAGRHHIVFRYAPFTLDNLADALRRMRQGRP
jgi:hypothetical protein